MEINNRRELAKYFNSLGFKTGAEVGVEMGRYSKVLCEEIPGVKLYGIDCWLRNLDKNPTDYEVAQQRLKPYGCTLIKDYSVEASKQFENGTLDFVYIDANHFYDYVMQDLIAWRPKVRKGGIVAGHDYFVSKRPGSSLSVVQAVNDYTFFHGYKINVIPGVKDAPTFGEKHPNFWFEV